MESGAKRSGDDGAIDATRPFRVGPWEVRPEINEIAQGETVVRLEPKAMHLLVLLAAHAGRTVSRAAMVEALWSGRAVTDDAINRQLAKLREALGDDPRTPVFIRTIPRTGVQLVAPVSGQTGGAARRSPAPPRAWIAVVVVLVLAVAVATAAWLSSRGPVRLGAETRLTSDVGAESQPALSPDGGQLAYAGGEGDQRVMVRTLDNPRAQPLSASGTAGGAPAWSPSGRLVAFVQTAPNCAVMIGSPSALTSRPAWSCAGWTVGRITWRDGRRLVISATHDHGPYQLLMLDVVSGRVSQLVPPPTSGLGDVLPMWLGGEGRLYFVRLRDGELADGDIFSLDPATGAVSQVTRSGGWFNEIAPGGAHGLTVLATHGETLFKIWRIDLKSGRWTPLTGTGDFIGLAASADGRRLVFGKASGSISLLRADATGTKPEEVLTTSTAIDWRPAFCGPSLAFLSSRSGSVQLWAMPLVRAAVPAQLTQEKGALEEFACARGGDLFALGVNYKGAYQLRLFNRGTGASDILTAAAYGLHVPTFSAAADAIYYVRAEGGRQVLIRHDLASNAETTIAADVTRALASTDGQALYFARRDGRSLWRLDLKTGAAALLAVLPVRFAPIDFVLGDDAVWVVGRPEPRQGAPLYRVALASGRVEAVRRLPDLFSANFGLAAQGANLVYPRLNRLDVDLYRTEVTRGPDR